MLAASLAFAGMGVLAHFLGGIHDWRILAVARSALPLLFTATWALLLRVRLVFWRPRILWLRSIAGSLSLLCTFYALPRLPVAAVYTLTNMFPLWLALLSWPMLGELPETSVWLSIASGLLGVYLIQQPHLEAGNWAVLAALGSSWFTALAMIGLHRLRGLDPRAIVVHFSAVALLMSLACLVVFERPESLYAWWDFQTCLLLLTVGLLATVGQWFLTLAFTVGTPARVSVVALSQVVFALGLDVTLLGHSFSAASLLGMVLVVAPTAWLLTSLSVR
jgi:drug/metabolite transporter (DMT)-like permease